MPGGQSVGNLRDRGAVWLKLVKNPVIKPVTDRPELLVK